MGRNFMRPLPDCPIVLKIARRTKRLLQNRLVFKSVAMKSIPPAARLFRLIAISTTGALFAQSCGGRVQDSVSDGFSLFITQSTISLLNSVFGFEDNGTSGDNNNDNGDPFDPPVQP